MNGAGAARAAERQRARGGREARGSGRPCASCSAARCDRDAAGDDNGIGCAADNRNRLIGRARAVDVEVMRSIAIRAARAQAELCARARVS